MNGFDQNSRASAAPSPAVMFSTSAPAEDATSDTDREIPAVFHLVTTITGAAIGLIISAFLGMRTTGLFWGFVLGGWSGFAIGIFLAFHSVLRQLKERNRNASATLHSDAHRLTGNDRSGK